MKIIYYANSFGSAYNSQVFELLQFLSTKVKAVYLVISLKEQIDIKIDNVNIITYKDVPEYPGCGLYHKKKLKKIFSDIQLDNQTIIHTRGHLSASYVMKALNRNEKCVKVFPDIRGAIVEEIRDFTSLNPILKFLKLTIVKHAFNKLMLSSGVSVVSESLRQYMLQRVKLPSHVFINHCIAGSRFRFLPEKRISFRKELGLKENDILVVFASGGNSPWQMEEQIIASFEKLNVKVLLLGYEGASTTNVLKIKVPYNSVPDYLSAADIGVLYRENHIVNKVASPIKFSEYLACGLPVIANDTVDHVVDVINKTKFGIIIDDFSKLTNNALKDLLQSPRLEISNWAKDKYSAEIIGNQYLYNYKSLLGK